MSLGGSPVAGTRGESRCTGANPRRYGWRSRCRSGCRRCRGSRTRCGGPGTDRSSTPRQAPGGPGRRYQQRRLMARAMVTGRVAEQFDIARAVLHRWRRGWSLRRPAHPYAGQSTASRAGTATPSGKLRGSEPRPLMGAHVNQSRPRFRDVPPQVDFPALDARILAFWRSSGIFEKSLQQTAGAPLFVFYEGPPTANGRPGVASRHLAHLQRHLPALQDDARLPRAAQGRLGHARPAGGARGRAPPRHRRQEADRGVRRRRVQPPLPRERHHLPGGVGPLHRAHRLLGRPGRRLLHVHQRVHRDGLVAAAPDLGQGPALPGLQGRALLPALRHRHQQPRGRAGLQGRHRGLGLRALPAHRRGGGAADRRRAGSRPVSLAVWTTTPWTLISNVAAAVHPDVDLRARREPRRALRAGRASWSSRCSARRPSWSASSPAPSCSACDYEPPYRLHATPTSAAHFVIGADYVTTTDGTGIVHIAPAFGEDDMRVGQENDLPLVNAVDTRGPVRRRGHARGPACSSRTPTRPSSPSSRSAACCSASSPTSTATPSAGAATRRCSTTARPTWYIRTTAIKDQLLAANDDVVWHPEHIKQGRFGEWLDNNVDWALSRDRYWGTPLPIWRCEKGHTHCVGSVAELRELAAGPVPDDLELHRPYVDDVVAALPECGGEMRRVPEVIDAWFDSRLHAVRAVALPVRERGRPSPSASRPTSSPRPSTRRAAGSTACSPWPRSSRGAAPTSASSAWATSWTPRVRR